MSTVEWGVEKTGSTVDERELKDYEDEEHNWYVRSRST